MEILYVFLTQIILPVYPDIIQVWKLIIESFYILFLKQDPKIIHSFRHKIIIYKIWAIRVKFSRHISITVWPDENYNLVYNFLLP